MPNRMVRVLSFYLERLKSRSETLACETHCSHAIKRFFELFQFSSQEAEIWHVYRFSDVESKSANRFSLSLFVWSLRPSCCQQAFHTCRSQTCSDSFLEFWSQQAETRWTCVTFCVDSKSANIFFLRPLLWILCDPCCLAHFSHMELQAAFCTFHSSEWK